MKLQNKVAIVTGAAQGIGEEMVRAFAAEGARVVIADVAQDKAGALAQDIGDKALAVRLDVRDPASIDATAKAAVEQFGGIDILVNNAAVFDMQPLLEATEASFDRQFAINVKGLFFTLQAVAKQMVEQGRGGKIINMSSQAGRRGEPLLPVYCPTKAAAIGQKKREVGEAVPLGRMGRPEDYGAPSVFLASSDSDYIVAQTLNVDGGNWMS
jgi:NAD(P)-dependent dehydrogenase (short-subunit alcohol dehydrogenase family)